MVNPLWYGVGLSSTLARTFNEVLRRSGMKHRPTAQAATRFREHCLGIATLERSGLCVARHGESVVVWCWIVIHSCTDIQRGAQEEWYEAQAHRTGGDAFSRALFRQCDVGAFGPVCCATWRSGMKHRPNAQAATRFREHCLGSATLERSGLCVARHGESVVVWCWIVIHSCTDIQRGAQEEWYEAQAQRTGGDAFSRALLRQCDVGAFGPVCCATWRRRVFESTVKTVRRWSVRACVLRDMVNPLWYGVGLSSTLARTFNEVLRRSGMKHRPNAQAATRFREHCLGSATLERSGLCVARHGESVVVWCWIVIHSCTDIQRGAQEEWYEAQAQRTGGDAFSRALLRQCDVGAFGPVCCATCATLERSGLCVARHGESVVVWCWIVIHSCTDIQRGAQEEWYEAQAQRTGGDAFSRALLRQCDVGAFGPVCCATWWRRVFDSTVKTVRRWSVRACVLRDMVNPLWYGVGLSSTLARTFNEVLRRSGMKHRPNAQAATRYRQHCLDSATLERSGLCVARHGESVVVWCWIVIHSCTDIQRGAQEEWYEAQAQRTGGDALSTALFRQCDVGAFGPVCCATW
ncbi:unnamed protein product [Closterium sp. Yama58-4]|nr:unnamed protein product [Closterium sp. Yama58-4]